MVRIEMMPFHDHPLDVLGSMPIQYKCWLCRLGGLAERNGDQASYKCNDKCGFAIHKECVELFFKLPVQGNHLFKLFCYHGRENDRLQCHLCRDTIAQNGAVACCMKSNIRMCLKCLKSPPPRTISQPKHHKHTFTLLMRRVTFTCNACGVEEACIPYVCLECDMMVHANCINLPRVIMINRHDHRISHTFQLGQGEEGDHDWKCGVCRKTIDWVYGAFKCSRCPQYAVHSHCATRWEVWDGVELEDVPEDEEILEDPFEVINENGDIIHFSHTGHILRSIENPVTDLRCEGCVLPINDDPCYECGECGFVLHKACASLPRKKRHLLHNHKLILQVDNKVPFKCKACQTVSNGFRYVCSEGCDERKCLFDVRCSSTSEPFHYDLHPQHSLYWTLEGSEQCKACLVITKDPLRCAVSGCNYSLCIACATLPRKVKSRYDDHFLRLSQGAENADGELWCDICETKTEPSVRYYTCLECGLALHVSCVLGGFYYMKEGFVHVLPGFYPEIDDPYSTEFLTNNGATRPVCSGCKSRCQFPFILRHSNTKLVDFSCDIACL